MKNVIYYSALVILCILITLLLDILVISPSIFILGFPDIYDFISIIIGYFEIWFISAGLTLLSRGYLRKIIICNEKSYSKVKAMALIIVGSILLILHIILNLVE